MSLISSLSRAAGRACLLLSLLNAVSAQAGETTNRLGITMVDIRDGSFVMGSCLQDKKSAFLGESSCANPDPDADDSEAPQHRVSVRAFKLGKTEVTLGQIKAFIKSAGRSDLVDDNFMKSNAYGDSAPVVQVSWEDASVHRLAEPHRGRRLPVAERGGMGTRLPRRRQRALLRRQ